MAADDIRIDAAAPAAKPKRKGMTRRILLWGGAAAGGGLALAVATANPWPRTKDRLGEIGKDGEVAMLGAFRIAPDDTVTVIVPHGDMGVGNGTALAQMLAEELGADWDKVRFERAPATDAFANGELGRAFLLLSNTGSDEVPGMLRNASYAATQKIAEGMHLQITGGSTAVRLTGHYAMRRAGAAGRHMLAEAAAKAWGLPKSDGIVIEKGVITDAASGKSARIGEMAEAAAAVKPPVEPVRKQKTAYTIVGKPKKRLDIPAKVDGTAVYGVDARVPGMAHAAIVSSPVPGGMLASVDEAPAAGMRGVIKVVKLGNAVAVVADSWWRAQKALAALKPQWTPGDNAGLDSAQTIAAMQASLTAKLKKDYVEGGGADALSGEGKQVEATYQVPYLAHAPMEPVGCLAHFTEDGGLAIHGGFQDALSTRYEAAEVAELPVEKVLIVHTEMGGSFGRRGPGSLNYVRHAVLVAKAAGRPVLLMYSREEDIRQDYYRNASVARLRARIDPEGKPAAFVHHFADKHDPPEATRVAYAIPAREAMYSEGANKAPWGAWRSVDHSHHGFFIESFIDEMALVAGKNPLAFRREMLAGDERRLRVLNRVAEMAGWDGTSPDDKAPGIHTGKGVALVESFGTIVAEIAEVSVDDAGKLRVTSVWAAADPGEVVNPDGFRAQIEGGIIYGLSAALHEGVTFKAGAVEQSNFTDYPVLTFADCPRIFVEIVESGAQIGGAGEPGTPPIGAAVANAIYTATGVRVRTLPFSKANLAVGSGQPA